MAEQAIVLCESAIAAGTVVLLVSALLCLFADTASVVDATILAFPFAALDGST